MYPEEIVKPFKLELTNSGFSELTSSEDVKNALSQSGTTLIAVSYTHLTLPTICSV